MNGYKNTYIAIRVRSLKNWDNWPSKDLIKSTFCEDKGQISQDTILYTGRCPGRRTLNELAAAQFES